MMRFSFYAVAALSACSASALSLQTQLDDEQNLAQVADYVSALPLEDQDTLSQLITELEIRADEPLEEDGALAQTILEGNLLQNDLNTIAEYIVHLREDQIHHIAERVKSDGETELVKVGSGPAPVAIRRPTPCAAATASGPTIIRPVAVRPQAGPRSVPIMMGTRAPESISRSAGGSSPVRTITRLPNGGAINSQRQLSGSLTGIRRSPQTGEAIGMALASRMNEMKHQSPEHGTIYTLEGDEGANLRRRDADGEETGMKMVGNGGIGYHHAPGEAAPRVGMFAKAGIDATNKQPGQVERGVGLRLKGDLYDDPSRNINHIERSIDGGLIGVSPDRALI